MRQRTSVDTGASRGLGLAIAIALAARGDHVICLARTRLKETPANCEFISADLSDPIQIAETFSRIAVEHEVSCLVNNAGVITPIAPMEQEADELFDRQVAVNMRALVQCTRAVASGMKQRGYGRIVNIGSRAAIGRAGLATYGATKAAVISYTRSWALEMAPHGITVNCISPGPIETEMLKANTPPGSPALARLLSAIPVGRAGHPEEIAAAVLYFASDEAAFTTGQTLYVCGGGSVGLTLV